MDTHTAFALGLITSALQMVFVMLSWILTTYLGRRTIYVWGSLINVGFLVALGIAGSVGDSKSASLAQASLGLIVSVLFTLGPAPASWVIIGETSAIRLRPLTTGVGRGAYYAVNIPCIWLASYMLNPRVRSSAAYHVEPQTLTKMTGWKPRWQVRLCLGCDRLHLLCAGLLLPARDEGQVLPRNRHSLQAQGPCPQVDKDCRRHQRRRVDGSRIERPWGSHACWVDYII